MRSRRLIKSLGLIVTALAIAAYAGRHTAPTARQAYYVKWVADGDTIQLENGRFVRYIGIDTPETEHSYRPAGYYGKEAYLYNKRLVEGKRVRLEFDMERIDKYDRLLAYVYVDDIFVNAKLVEDGYARTLTIPPNVKYADLFLRLERGARKSRRGLWGGRP